MATTTYAVFADGEQIATKSKKQVAVDLATATRDEQRVSVRVETQNGTVVFEQDAPKKINMSKPYTRTVNATLSDEQVEVVDGKRVAYKRGRTGAQFALLDANWTGEGPGTYSIWDLDRHEQVDIEVATTRQAGRWFADERVAYREAHPVVTA